MHLNAVYHDVNDALPSLLGMLEHADEVGSRAGRTKELTHIGITLTEPLNREILLNHRKPNLAAQIAETMWVLSGRDDMEFLSHYLPRAKDFSDDGISWRAGYGKRLRGWDSEPTNTAIPTESHFAIDQLAYVVDLLNRDPGTRQAVMSIWDPVIDTKPGKDIPCNDWLHFLSRHGYLDLHVALRSNDVIWGWSGINQFEWSALLEIVAGLTGMKVGSLHFSTTSFHIYDHHWEKGEKIAADALLPGNDWREQVVKESPRFDMGHVGDRNLERFDELCRLWFQVEYDIRTGSPLVDHYIDTFPEPMLKSWLRVIDWWWNGRHDALRDLGGTRLEMATHYSVQPAGRAPKPTAAEGTLQAFVGGPMPGHSDLVKRDEDISRLVRGPVGSDFIKSAIALHDEKHQAYGDSWKRRGEMLGIMANIARKVDRLGGSETADETSADTALDLMIYLAKYRAWLAGHSVEVLATDEMADHAANAVLRGTDLKMYPTLEEPVPSGYVAGLHEVLRDGFDFLEKLVMDKRPATERMEQVDRLLLSAYRLAVYLNGSTSEDEYRGADVD